MRSYRSRLALAAPAFVVALFVVTAIAATSNFAPSAANASTASSQHGITMREASPATALASATAPLRRFSSFDSLVGYLVVPPSVALALLIWVAAALSFQLLLLGAGLSRRGRAPPLAYA